MRALHLGETNNLKPRETRYVQPKHSTVPSVTRKAAMCTKKGAEEKARDMCICEVQTGVFHGEGLIIIMTDPVNTK